MSKELVKGTSTEVSYQANGHEVVLTADIVRDNIARGNSKVTDKEIVGFINLCKYNQLNPFLGEAYLVKFGDKPADMITSKEAYYKRADSCPDYEGVDGGVIIEVNGEIKEMEGSFAPQSSKLLGGWARVYRKDRRPTYVSVNITEYDKGQSTWNTKKATMIVKVAKVQALREAFPAQLGSMYIQEEYSKTESHPQHNEQSEKVAEIFAEVIEAEVVQEVPESTQKLISYFQKQYNINEEQILHFIGLSNVFEINEEWVDKLRLVDKGIKDNFLTIDQFTSLTFDELYGDK